MKPREAAWPLAERLRLLEMEAGLQRVELTAQLEQWQEQRWLSAGTSLLGSALHFLWRPSVRWLLLARLLRGRRRK